MSDDMTVKEALVEKAVSLGLGDEKFLSKISEENLKNMVSLVESKDGQIETLKAGKPEAEESSKVIRVKHLVAANRIQVAKSPDDLKEEIAEMVKDKSDDGEDK